MRTGSFPASNWPRIKILDLSEFISRITNVFGGWGFLAASHTQDLVCGAVGSLGIGAMDTRSALEVLSPPPASKRHSCLLPPGPRETVYLLMCQWWGGGELFTQSS